MKLLHFFVGFLNFLAKGLLCYFKQLKLLIDLISLLFVFLCKSLALMIIVIVNEAVRTDTWTTWYTVENMFLVMFFAKTCHPCFKFFLLDLFERPISYIVVSAYIYFTNGASVLVQLIDTDLAHEGFAALWTHQDLTADWIMTDYAIRSSFLLPMILFQTIRVRVQTESVLPFLSLDHLLLLKL